MSKKGYDDFRKLILPNLIMGGKPMLALKIKNRVDKIRELYSKMAMVKKIEALEEARKKLEKASNSKLENTGSLASKTQTTIDYLKKQCGYANLTNSGHTAFESLKTDLDKYFEKLRQVIVSDTKMTSAAFSKLFDESSIRTTSKGKPSKSTPYIDKIISCCNNFNTNDKLQKFTSNCATLSKAFDEALKFARIHFTSVLADKYILEFMTNSSANLKSINNTIYTGQENLIKILNN